MSVEAKEAKESRSVSWDDDKRAVRIIDQKKLPASLEFISCDSVDSVAHHIQIMTVRGAPAIGAAGAFGMAIAAFASKTDNSSDLLKDLEKAKKQLDDARPTAVNLSWATERIVSLVKALLKHNSQVPVAKIRDIVAQEAKQLAEDDVAINRRLGDYGSELVNENDNLLHHCNTGSLATVDYGTALGIIYSAHEKKKNIHVYVDETRPRLQGARLTAWELMRAKIPMHLIVDGASGHLMRKGKINVIVFGADRVAANGDVANKIGTYNLAVCGRENGVPVYAAVPTSTIDLNILHGDDIPIEERNPEEVTKVGDSRVAPENVQVYNPAFDVTPHKYITGIVTEEGICYPPFNKSLKAAKKRAEERAEATWKQRLVEYFKSS